MSIADRLLEPLRGFGYVTPPECNANLPERRWLMRHSGGHRTHHLHLIILSSEGWTRTLKFRDVLRAHAGLCETYKELKMQLARTVGSDRNRYIQGKTQFVEDLLKKY